MNKIGTYPVAIGDMNIRERKKYGMVNVGAVRTGEFRRPQRGEWFVSGAKPQAYKAPNDLSTEYHIAILV